VDERRHDRPDPLDAALARVGDRWTLLVVAALLDGPKRFNELTEAVTGVAPNILSNRLKQLEANGIVLAEPYSARPPRSTYRLTAAGAELAGALRLLAQWGAQQGEGDVELVAHDVCGTPVEARWWCPTCEQVVDGPEMGDLRFA
jgi:DNA-binding HxlR family transcriptional regulator